MRVNAFFETGTGALPAAMRLYSVLWGMVRNQKLKPTVPMTLCESKSERL